MAAEGAFLAHTAIYLGAAVVAVPLFKRLGLGSVLGYLVAGAVIGPFGLALVGDAESVLHFAEFGVEPQRVIVAGFGRVGQIVTQLMAARGITVTAIDHDPKRIEIAKHYCRKVYFADVRRADVLATAGAGEARLIFLCVDDPDACIEAIRHARAAFPQLEIVARAYDRDHVLRLLKEDADCFVRETFESSIAMGREGLRRSTSTPGRRRHRSGVPAPRRRAIPHPAGRGPACRRRAGLHPLWRQRVIRHEIVIVSLRRRAADDWLGERALR